VVYLSDHGDFLFDYGLMRKGVGTPEVLTRIPMIWRGPGIQGSACQTAFVSIADVMPTLCEAIGARLPAGTQGRSLWPLLTGGEYPQSEFESIYIEAGFGGMYYGPEDDIDLASATIRGSAGAVRTFDELNPVTQSGTTKTIRRGDWKLSWDMMGTGELYNITEDYYERANLYDHPDAKSIRDQLIAELLTWTIRTQDDLPVAAYAPKWPLRNWYASYRGA
jgi:arylsulfatase A-like enzyme